MLMMYVVVAVAVTFVSCNDFDDEKDVTDDDCDLSSIS